MLFLKWLKFLFIACLKLPFLHEFFTLDEKFYEQSDSVAMGSPLGPTLAKVFVCHFKKNW